jgi:hypothetical protein
MECEFRMRPRNMMKQLIILILINFGYGFGQIESTEIRKYYVNGSLSVRITPWEEGRRFWYLYSIEGEETIVLEEVRLSYSVSYTADYHENGAVRSIKVHENPGASMYWYEGLMRFTTTNEPIDRQFSQMPPQHLSIDAESWTYWDRKTKTWRKQEVMECNPPHKE